MKKFSFLITILLLCAVSLFAQAPEKFSYQAVVRNASNALVTDAQVGVRVSILQGSASGNAVYVETHSANANANGLLTVEIGGGSVQQGVFADIDWANGPYFLKTETDPNGGSSYTVTSTQQLLSVPYALYAEEAGNGFSGDYNDLTNRPEIQEIPDSVSAFVNDAGYITMADLQILLDGLNNTIDSLRDRIEDLENPHAAYERLRDSHDKSYHFDEHIENLKFMATMDTEYPKPSKVYHVVIVTAYNEGLEVL